MLVLSRKHDSSIKIGDDIEVIVVGIKRNRVRLGVRAPRTLRILRDDAKRRKSA